MNDDLDVVTKTIESLLKSQIYFLAALQKDTLQKGIFWELAFNENLDSINKIAKIFDIDLPDIDSVNLDAQITTELSDKELTPIEYLEKLYNE